MEEDKSIKICLYILFIVSAVWLLLYIFSCMGIRFPKHFLFIFAVLYVIYVLVLGNVFSIKEYIEQQKLINALRKEIENNDINKNAF